MADTTYRHELKYFINALQYHQLRQRLRAWMHPDRHAGQRGEYRITSLYFDDAADSALHDKLSGVQHRQKVRVRIYDGRNDVIMLEKKCKAGDAIHKDRLRINRRLYECLLAGVAGPLRDEGQPLLDEVAWLVANRLLRPKVIVDYFREAYTHPLGNVRVTFDKHLSSGLTNLDLFQPAPMVPAPIDGLTILEVKYDAYLPRPVQDLLQTGNLARQAASKYVLCRSFLKTHSWEDQLA